jgi:hypothetical protein
LTLDHCLLQLKYHIWMLSSCSCDAFEFNNIASAYKSVNVFIAFCTIQYKWNPIYCRLNQSTNDYIYMQASLVHIYCSINQFLHLWWYFLVIHCYVYKSFVFWWHMRFSPLMCLALISNCICCVKANLP